MSIKKLLILFTFSFLVLYATNSSQVNHGDIQINTESIDTTHFTVFDSYGSAIAVVNTLNRSFRF